MNNAKYVEVVNWIKEKIENKELLPGTKIYSEYELSAMFHLSRQTIRHAIGMLEKMGIVIRVKGSGTFVSPRLGNMISERKRVAVITTYVDSYIFPKTIQGIVQVMSDHGYAVQISFTNNKVEREQTILEELIEKDEVAGIIMEPIKSGLPNPNLDLYHELLRLQIPILFINSYYPDIDIPHVSLNDMITAQKATQYLINAGHQKIGAIFKSDDGQGHLRYQGYFQAMKKAKLPIEDSFVVWIDTYDMKKLSNMKDYIIYRIRTCTAILCYNDEIAYEVINFLKREGIRVPEDISIIGIDGSELSMQGEIKITTLPHPMEELGKKAAKNLISMMKDPLFDGTYEFDSDILVQDSVMCR